MEPLLAALAVAHRAGLVHRDVKPENILLSDEGVVKVADFGLARAVEAEASATRTGLMMGTVAYCSPEHVSRGGTDQRSDVYSAGVVLFELLTGQPPFTGESAIAVAYQHVHSRVPAPSSRTRGLPEMLDDLVVRATDNDPAGRPADAGQFLAELHNVRAGLNLPVIPVPPRPRPTEWGIQPDGPARRPSTTSTGRPIRSVPRHASTTPWRSLSPVCPGPSRQAHQGASRRGEDPATQAPADRLDPRPAARGRVGVCRLVVRVRPLQAHPEHRGRAANDRIARSAECRLRPHERPHWVRRDDAPDDAIRTDPDAGAQALPNKSVTLVVSSGKERFTVSDVHNASVDAAKAALANIPGAHIVTTQARDGGQGHGDGTNPPAGDRSRAAPRYGCRSRPVHPSSPSLTSPTNRGTSSQGASPTPIQGERRARRRVTPCQPDR